MQVSTKRTMQDNIPELKKAQYRIDDKAVVHITRILRNMYEDPVKAVVREYIANAYDAHNQIGQTKPIMVDAPTRMAPTFRVRDFGPGLSVEEVEQLLLGYGASGEFKRTSNEQIGGFGIGCKCAFAISDSFTYISWHQGKKQTWLCQLDERDMGQAKLIAHEESKEPSGLMVEIPVSASQMPLFEKQLKQVPLFFQQPIKVSGSLFKPADDIGVKLKGTMTGKFAGSEWMFYTLKNGLTNVIDDDIVVIMGDLWYPLDKSFVGELAETRLMKIIRPGNRGYGYGSDRRAFRCAIRAPIGTFSLAPTREGLQYDTATRKLLKEAFAEIEANIDTMSQKAVDACPDEWSAIDKALSLQANLMYSLKLQNKEPVLTWRGKTRPIEDIVGIKAAADTTGAKVFLMTRDMRKADYASYRSSSDGNLKVWDFVINDASEMPVTSSGKLGITVPAKSITAEFSLGDLAKTGDSYDDTEKEVGQPVYAKLKTGAKSPFKVEKYVLPVPIPVFTMSPKNDAVFYGRRYLTQTGQHTPDRRAFALVVQGTEDQQKAFFALYPWLNKNVKPLPLLKAAPKVVTASDGTKREVKYRSFKSVDNLLSYVGKADVKLPSASWKTLTKLPDTAKYYTYLEKFVPVPRRAKNVKAGDVMTLSPATQFGWLDGMVKLMSSITRDKDIDVYGLRDVGEDVKEPANLVLLQDALADELKKWFDPATMGQYKVHGLQIMTRFGPDSLFGEYHIRNPRGSSDELVNFDEKTKRKVSRSWYRSQGDGLALLALIRHNQTWARAQKLPANSQFRKTVELYRSMTGMDVLGKVELEKYNEALHELRTHTLRKPELLTGDLLNDAIRKDLKKYMTPLQEAVDKAWAKYTVLGMLAEIPGEGADTAAVDAVLDYIEIVDSK